MEIEYLDYLPEAFVKQGLDLYFHVFRDKYLPIVEDLSFFQEICTDSISRNSCLCAISHDRIVGLMALKTKADSFLHIKESALIQRFGMIGGLFRLGGLICMDYKVKKNEIYVDAVAVDSSLRSRGIGRSFFSMIEEKALTMKASNISLDVIAENTRAIQLYEKLGFHKTGTSFFWPLNRIFGLTFNRALHMEKKILV